MAIKLISLRAFLTEISSSIVSANERLLGQGHAEQTPPEGWVYPIKNTPLEIKSVRVSFSARVANRRLTNSKPVRQDEILLDFVTEGKWSPNNIYGEVLFSGKGEPMELEGLPPEGPEAPAPAESEAAEIFPKEETFLEKT